MATKGVARAELGFVPAGNPRPALDQVVAAIEGRGGEIVIVGMHFEAIERIDRRFCPLPDIADYIVEFAMAKLGDGTG